MLNWENGAQAFFDGWSYDYEACKEWKAGWADAYHSIDVRYNSVNMTGFIATLTQEQKDRIFNYESE